MKTDIDPNVYTEFLIKPHFEYLNSWTFIIGSLKHTKIKLLLILFNCTSIMGEINCAWMLDCHVNTWLVLLVTKQYSRLSQSQLKGTRHILHLSWSSVWWHEVQMLTARFPSLCFLFQQHFPCGQLSKLKMLSPHWIANQ